MSQQLALEITGLQTNPSPLNTKKGSLSVARNVNIDSPNTATSRRGFKKYGSILPTTGNYEFDQFNNYNGTILASYGGSLYYDSDDAGTWQEYGAEVIAADSTIKLRTVEHQGAFYMATNNGIRKLESVTSSIRNAGVPKALSFDATLTGSSGFFSLDSQVAYRTVWGYTDINDIVHLGSPSERTEVSNASTGDSYNVSLDIYIPTGITTSYYYQVYRSGFSVDADTVANDELQLVYESFPTDAEITAGVITFTDNIPDSLRGASLYTSPTQEGIIESNDQPPFAKDIAMYKNYCFFANTRTKHRKYLTLVAVAGDYGIDTGDIITIDGVDYTGAVAQDHTAGEFLIPGTGTASEKIRDAAKSLVQVINRYSTNTSIYAYYVSGYAELPGQILLEKRDLTDDVFYITYTTANTGVDHGIAWNPSLPAAGTSIASDNETKASRLYISKYSQVDAVPPLNYLDAGGEEGAIQRILALRDSLFIFKDDGSIWRLVGETPENFNLHLFDNTTKLVGPRTAAVFNNSIFCFTDQGISAISDNGVAVKSWAIEDQLREYLSISLYPNFETDAFAVSYESDRKYLFSVGDRVFSYNSFTNSWTRWDISATAGFINPTDDKLYLGKTDAYVYQERKDYTRFDYADAEYDVTIVSYSGTVVTLSDTSSIDAKMSLKQGNTTAYISSVDSSTEITLDRESVWTAGAAVVTEPILCRMKWLPIDGENPGMMKRFREVHLYFKSMNDQFDIIFNNNFLPSDDTSVTMNPVLNGRDWGDGRWGRFEWGGAETENQEMWTYPPLDLMRALWLNVEVQTERSFTNFSLIAASIMYEDSDTKYIPA